MKKTAFYLFILSKTFFIGFYVYSLSPDTISKNEVLRLTKELHEAEKNKDTNKLRQILADEVFYSRNNAEEVFIKEGLINNLIAKSKEAEIETIEAESVSCKITENQIKVFFYMKVNFAGNNGKIFDHTGNYTYAFEKQSDKWKLVSIHLEN